MDTTHGRSLRQRLQPGGPRQLRSVLLLLCACAAGLAALGPSPAGAASSWAGASSYYLHAFRPASQAQVLDAMQAAGFKAVRIFINHIEANAKTGYNGVRTDNVRIPDLEDDAVGSYDDTILQAIDSLMVQVVKRKMKLIIALHDRYSLGCWGSDAYVKKYNIPTADCSQSPEQNNIIDFYRNSAAAADMDRRFAHILAHKNPSFGNRPWSAIPEAILGFDIENESQAHSANGVIANPNWVCDRASKLKPKLTSGILLFTGGGADIWDSALSQHFACPSIDVVAVHTYGGADALSGQLGQVLQTARAAGKRIVVEEFGASGDGKAGSLGSQISAIQRFGVPWLMWEVMKPGSSDFETFTDDAASWSVLTSGARTALSQGGAFSWPEVTGGPSPTPTPGPAPKPTPNPTPKPTAAPTPSGACGKCNVALCKGGCKCDNQCSCRAGLGGSACDKCNMAQSQGGCKCDNNCNCLAGSCWF